MADSALNLRQNLRHYFGLYLTREAVMLALLAGLAAVLFAGVTGLSRLYHAQQASLGDRWFGRGVTDLSARRFDRAVVEFRAALVYSPDDYAYQLNLAEALLGLKQTGQAYAYLINLWDDQPDDGLVNLELARIAAQRGQTDQALRYYHNAIYATWSDEVRSDDALKTSSGVPTDVSGNDAASRERVERRNARLELIEFLLRTHDTTKAQSELLALSENVGDDAREQARVGDLYIRAQDYEHALAAYLTSLNLNRGNAASLAGAGLAAFELGRYDLARRYLQAEVDGNPGDTQSADRLKTAELVLRMDPFRSGISAAERDRAVIEDFTIAGERLKSCGAGEIGGSGSTTDLSTSWTKINPQMTLPVLRKNPDMATEAMNMVFNIERQATAACGIPAGSDLALLLIANLHEGN
jgi:predicted negative regulator of RcsB-dependent stress response